MIREDKVKNLDMLPWQALFEVAVKKGIDEAEVKGKDKSAIIEKVLAEDVLDDQEIESLVNNYIYGDRVTFTLWSFDADIDENIFPTVLSLEGLFEPFVDVTGFRNLQILSVNDRDNRYEILYVYSKEYSFTNEDGHADSVWELHRGCIWIGKQANYIASISKHDRMARVMISFLSAQLHNTIKQIKPPKAAIERCINYTAISRIVLQSADGEKTIISKADGFTAAQQDEVARVREGRFDTSGSYIAKIKPNTTATIKYNVNKGNIGIYKHLSAVELFDWSEKAISIVLEEIEKLRGRPAAEIFQELGLELKWNIVPSGDYQKINWFLTEVIAAHDDDYEHIATIPDQYKSILDDKTLFMKIPRIYCNECESFEIPICAHCGSPVKLDGNGRIFCECGAPVKLTCGENHSRTELTYWYVPTQKLLRAIDKNVQKIYKGSKLSSFCVFGNDLHIIKDNNDTSVEVAFSEVIEFQTNNTANAQIVAYAIRMNEKCNGTCSLAKISKCIKDTSMTCLPKVFYSILPGYRPQPHMNGEYGDVAGQITTANRSYEMKGIIKKNTKNTARGNRKPDNELIEETLKSTSAEGQEMLRQFVEQGLADSRAEVVAVIAPQYFDAGLKGTLRYLARVGKKKVMFIGLDEISLLLSMNKTIAIS